MTSRGLTAIICLPRTGHRNIIFSLPHACMHAADPLLQYPLLLAV
jgi:hypothetical protein